MIEQGKALYSYRKSDGGRKGGKWPTSCSGNEKRKRPTGLGGGRDAFRRSSKRKGKSRDRREERGAHSLERLLPRWFDFTKADLKKRGKGCGVGKKSVRWRKRAARLERMDIRYNPEEEEAVSRRGPWRGHQE